MESSAGMPVLSGLTELRSGMTRSEGLLAAFFAAFLEEDLADLPGAREVLRFLLDDGDMDEILLCAGKDIT